MASGLRRARSSAPPQLRKVAVLAAVLLALAVGFASAIVPTPIAALALGGSLVVLLALTRWPLIPLLSLAVVMSIPRFSLDLQGITINSERVLLPCLLLAAVAAQLYRRDARPRAGWAHVGLIVYLIALASSSILVAPDRAQSERLTVLVAVASSPFWLVPILTSRPHWVRVGFGAFLVAAFTEALLGVTSVVINVTTGVELGLQRDSLTGVLTPFGTQFEGNIFGSFVAAGFVGWLAWLVGRPGGLQRRWLEIGVLLVLGLGVAVSFSRGAWIAAAAGTLIVVVAGSRGRRFAALTAAGVSIGVVAAVVLVVANTPFGTGFVTRLVSLPAVATGSVVDTRFDQQYTQGLIFVDWSTSPIIGTGTGSLGESYRYLTVNVPAWNGNLELHVLHDSGLLGVFGLTTLITATALPLIRLLRRPERGGDTPIVLSALAIMVVLLVAFQATEATYLAWSWYLLGLAWSAGHPRSQESPRAVDRIY